MNTDTIEQASNAPFSSAVDIGAAIAALKNSTRQINASCDFLVASGTVLQTRPRAFENRASKTEEQSRLIHGLESTVDDTERVAAEKLKRSVHATVIAASDVLARHDHEFVQLEDPQHVKLSQNEDEHSSAELLSALRYTWAEVIRTRLNRRYLEALAPKHINGTKRENKHENDVSIAAKIDLAQHDMQTLYSDIDDVAQMLAMHEYGDHLDAANEKLCSGRRMLQACQTRKAQDQIGAMTRQLEALLEHAELLQSHRLLRSELSSRVGACKPPEDKAMSSIPATVGLQPPERKFSALVNLRQYVGIAGASGQSDRTASIDSIFEELAVHFNSTLAIQAEQASRLQTPTMEDTHFQAHVSELERIDRAIADVKSRMDLTSA